MLKQTFAAFSNRDFRILWLGACISSIGGWMQRVAQSWLVYDLTGSSALLGLDAFMGELPIMLLSMYGGVVADRRDRRQILIASQVVQLLCALVLSLLLFSGLVRGMPLIYIMIGLSFLTGIAQAFGGPAYQALIPSLVEREQMPNAIALNSIQFNIARIIGPILAGVTLKQLGGEWCFMLNAASFLPVIASLYIARPGFVPKPSAESALDSIKQAFSFIKQKEGMRTLIGLAATMTFLGVPINTFLPVISKEVFRQSDATLFTAFLTAFGVGSVGGALVVANVGKREGKGPLALALLGSLGVLIAGFGFSTNQELSIGLLFLAGAALVGSFALVAGLVQELVPNELRGRVMSIYNMAFRGGMPLGNLATGELMQIIPSPSLVLAIEGVALVAASALFYFTRKDIRRIGSVQ